MPSFEMLIGLPASGKTTYATAKESEGFVRVSSDDVRHDLFGDGGYTKQEQAQVFGEVNKRITDALVNGKNVIMDATNLTRKHRIETMNRLPIGVNNITARLFLSPIDKLIKRNASRDYAVPEDTYDRMLKHFDPPSMLIENFDKIEMVFEDGPYDMSPYDDWDVLKRITHDNKYHAETIGSHLLTAESIGEEFDPIIRYAAKYHDIGKVLAKSFYNRKGEKVDNAVFYNHENIGSYIWLLLWHTQEELFGLDYEDALDVALLINLHMRPFVWEKSHDTFIRDVKRLRRPRWANDFDYDDKILKDILLLHQIDLSAKTEVKHVK